MINNFDKITEFLKFIDKNTFYYISCLKRRKDNPDMKKDVKVIDQFYVYSKEELEKVKPKIIDNCDLNNARCYIRLNCRDAQKIAYQTQKIMIDYIIGGDFKSVRNAYDSACGQFSSDKEKKWLIDVDDINILSDIEEVLIENKSEIYLNLPTKNGLHLIVKPFDRRKFDIKFPNLIHKDGAALMYFPNM